MLHHSCTQGQADVYTSVMWALSTICCWPSLAVSKPISPALTLPWSTVPLPDCLDMVERAPVEVGLSILESASIPATAVVTAAPAVKEAIRRTPLQSQTVRCHPHLWHHNSTELCSSWLPGPAPLSRGGARIQLGNTLT